MNDICIARYLLTRNGKQNQRASIYYEEDAMDPRMDFSNYSHIFIWHNNYSIGDKHLKHPQDQIKLLYEELGIDIPSSFGNIGLIESLYNRDDIVIKLINMYDHSGITISTSTSYPYNDQWDSSTVGFVYVLKSELVEIFDVDDDWKERAEQIIESEMDILDRYIRGDVYCIHIENKVKVISRKYDEYLEVINEEESTEWELYECVSDLYIDPDDDNEVAQQLDFDVEKIDKWEE